MATTQDGITTINVTGEELEDSVSKKHEHSNKTVLDKLSVSNDGKLQYEGSNVNENQDLSEYAKKTDENLSTEDKTIVGAIVEINGEVGMKPSVTPSHYEKVNNITLNSMDWVFDKKESEEGTGLAEYIDYENIDVIRVNKGLHENIAYEVNFGMVSATSMTLTFNFYKRDKSNKTGYTRYGTPLVLNSNTGDMVIPSGFSDLLSISVQHNGSYNPNIKPKDCLLVVETVSDDNKEISLSEVSDIAKLGDYVILVGEKTINSTGLYKYIENKTDECIKKTDGVNELSINSTEQQYANAKATYLHIEERLNSIKSAKKVWDKPLLNLDTTELNTVYYYQTGDNAWINKLWIPATQDYEPGVYAYFDGIKWLTFNVSDVSVPALSQKDVYKFYVLYNEKYSKCQARAVEIATGTDEAIGGWSNIITRDEKPEGAIEVVEERYDRLGVWYKTVYLGDDKINCFDITVSLSQDETGHLMTSDISTVIDENSTNITIPTSKAVYDRLQNIAIPSTEPKTKIIGSIWLV